MTPVAVVVGPPGAGKTTVGTALAARLGVAFLDTDAAVEQRAGRSIGDIFTTDGEDAFRALEAEAVTEALGRHAGVLALGGGAPTSAAVRAALAGHPVVFLSVGLAAGVRRTGMSTARPLLAGINPRATFQALLEARLPLYREVAVHEIATDDLDPDAVVDAVARALDGGAPDPTGERARDR